MLADVMIRHLRFDACSHQLGRLVVQTLTPTKEAGHSLDVVYDTASENAGPSDGDRKGHAWKWA